MKLEKIITMANRNTEIRFLAMERSLRATGCELPLWVIPYDDKKFELPENASWWELPEVVSWLEKQQCRGVFRKYQCLLEGNYQFVDSDVVFMRNPEEVLESKQGWISSCGHWHNPGQTYTAESITYFKRFTTTWQKRIFNTGQFACDRPLFDLNSLKNVAESNDFKPTCIDFKFHEQPGINQLVFQSGVEVTNLTLGTMESTWAGDYPGIHYSFGWTNESKPYLIHWAGCAMDIQRPIDKEFLQYLTPKETITWEEELSQLKKKKTFYRRCRRYLSRIKQALTQIHFD